MSTEEFRELDAAVTPKLLRRIAGERYFERGEDYFDNGAVRSLRQQDDCVEASVRGTRSYRVRLWMDGGQLCHDCNCPLGRDDEFCKHCVAVGLAWHAKTRRGAEGVEDAESSSFTEVDIRDHLMRLDKEALVSMLLEQADEDERLSRRLRIQAARATDGTANFSVWKEAFSDATAFDEFIPYREAYDHACGIEEVVDSVEELLRSGQAAGVIELAEYGLSAVEGSLQHTDDSDGWMYGQLERLREIHLEACLRARPDPVELAGRLFEWEMESSFDTFYRAIVDYADVLGETGLSAYRALAEAEWAKVPALGPGDKNPDRYGLRWRIAAIMDAYAETADDLDARVAIKSRDLSEPGAFLAIAQLYRDAGDGDRALDWAERGWRAFPDRRRDERLRAFITDAYQEKGRTDEAMAIIWEAFADRPWFANYRQLEEHARRAGDWLGWRDKALAMIREGIAREPVKTSAQPAWMRGPFGDHSVLVEIFLHEGDTGEAWREAKAGGCSRTLWLALAKQREQAHPEDSIEIYKGHVAALLTNTGDSVYKEAIGFLGRIKALLADSEQETAFRPYLAEIRTAHRRKRNLMKMLDVKGW